MPKLLSSDDDRRTPDFRNSSSRVAQPSTLRESRSSRWITTRSTFGTGRAPPVSRVRGGRWLCLNSLRHRTALGAESTRPRAVIVRTPRRRRTEPGTKTGRHLNSPIAGCRWRSGPAVRRPTRRWPGHPSDCGLPTLIGSHDILPSDRVGNPVGVVRRAGRGRQQTPPVNRRKPRIGTRRLGVRPQPRGLGAPPRKSKFPTGERRLGAKTRGMWRIQATAVASAAVKIMGLGVETQTVWLKSPLTCRLTTRNLQGMENEPLMQRRGGSHPSWGADAIVSNCS